jgi:hypothetical protein
MKRGPKLGPHDVLRLRQLYYHHEVSVACLCESFGISRFHCISVIKHKKWKQPELRVTASSLAVPEPIVHAVKLDRFDVKEIRRLYSQGKMNTVQLARSYGVSHSTISRVIRGQTWKRSKADVKREYNAERMRRNRAKERAAA